MDILKNIISIILLFAIHISFAQWEQRFPAKPTAGISALTIHHNEIFIGTSGGGIYKCNVAANKWIRTGIIPRDYISRIVFIDSLNGFVFARHSFIGDTVSLLKTTDGGNEWLQLKSPGINTALTIFPLSGSELLTSQVNIGLTKYNIATGEESVVYAIPKYFEIDVYGSYGEITDFSQNAGGSLFALGNSINARRSSIIKDSVTFILKSTNGGVLWDTLWTGSQLGHIVFSFVDSLTAWIAGEQLSIMKTTDGGISWIAQYLDTTMVHWQYIVDIASPSKNIAIAVTNNGYIIKTTNGGISWDKTKPIDMINDDFSFSAIQFRDSLFGIACGKGGILIRTTDGGISWNRMDSSAEGTVRRLQFVSATRGYAVVSGELHSSADGGYSWKKISISDSSGSINSVYMIDSLVGFVTTKQRISKTTDGGVSWTMHPMIFKNNDGGWMGITFFNAQYGIVSEVREFQPVNIRNIYNYITMDGGISWNEYLLNIHVSSFDKVVITSPFNAYFWSQQGLWQTSDSAKTWELIHTQLPQYQSSSFDFIDSLNGWAHFWSQNIGKTTDGGKTWTLFPIPYMNQVMDIRFADQNIGCTVGYNGSIFFTSDGGLTWRAENSETNYYFTKISMHREGNTAHFWIGGDGWNIKHKQILLTSVGSYTKIIPSDFSISQNYPNPFNPSTTFEYQIPHRSFVSLKIFDAIGREAASLVNEDKSAGIFRTTWNAAGYSTGLYFARMTAGSYSAVKKLMLIK